MKKRKALFVPAIMILMTSSGQAFGLIAQEKERSIFTLIPKERQNPTFVFGIEHLLIKPTETIRIGTATLKTYGSAYNLYKSPAIKDEVGLEITPRLIDEKGIELKIRILKNGKSIKEEKIFTRNLEPFIVELLENETDDLKLAAKITPLILPVYPSPKEPSALPPIPLELRGRVLSGAGTGLPPVMKIKIAIDDYTTRDEAALLQDFMARNDSQGFFEAFKEAKKGSLRFIGETGAEIVFHAAFAAPTDRGMKIILAGEFQNLPAGYSPHAEAWKVLSPGRTKSGSFLFLVAEMNLDKNFKGEGKVYEEAKIAFTPEGGIKLDTYLKTPKMIINIEKSK